MAEFEDKWEDENTVETFVYNGRPCVVTQHPTIGHFCGYTKTNLPNLNNTSYYEGDNYVKLIDVHGGITYGKDDEGWVGFDCGHAGDMCIKDEEIQNNTVVSKDTEWYVEDVKEELKCLADQISALEKYIEENITKEYKY